MRRRKDSTNPPTPPPENVFSADFLEHLKKLDNPWAPQEAKYAGPWKLEHMPDRLGVWAVLRTWEDLELGSMPEGVFMNPRVGDLFAIVLPLLSREPIFTLRQEKEPDGFAIETLDGVEEGREVVGWIRRPEPRIVEALYLLEGIIRSPMVLVALLEAAGPWAQEQVGRILAEKL